MLENVQQQHYIICIRERIWTHKCKFISNVITIFNLHFNSDIGTADSRNRQPTTKHTICHDVWATHDTMSQKHAAWLAALILTYKPQSANCYVASADVAVCNYKTAKCNYTPLWGNYAHTVSAVPHR